jgi:speckle-type POZ protein
VEGKKLFGHRNILAVRSSYFKTMFLGSEKMKMKEANQEEIPIQNTSYSAFLALLRYLYTESLPGEDIEVLLEILALSNLYQFDRLKADISFLIERHITIENCALLYQHAHHTISLDLKKVLLEFILKNYTAIQGTSGYSQLEDELIAEILQQKLNREG